MNNEITILGYVCGLGAGNSGTRDGPRAIIQQLHDNELSPDFFYSQNELHGLAAMPILAEINSQLAQRTFDLVSCKKPFIILGGDHSSAVGTWSGVASALKSRGDLGLIWFDAHMDSHTPETTPSNNIHGMPLASLLGFGDSALTEILIPTAKVKPENLCLIGIRSFEPPEQKLLENLGVRIFYMSEIEQRGITDVLTEALAIVTKNTAGFGISFDLDAIDPTEAPGVGSPAPKGISAPTLLNSLKTWQNHPKLLGLEIAEYNPHLDIDHRTADIAINLCENLFG